MTQEEIEKMSDEELKKYEEENDGDWDIDCDGCIGKYYIQHSESMARNIKKQAIEEFKKRLIEEVRCCTDFSSKDLGKEVIIFRLDKEKIIDLINNIK